MSESQDEIYNGLVRKIDETERLIEECKKLTDLAGKSKLQRKIEAELKFLKRLTKNRDKLKEEHIRSSNIYHLSAIVRSCIEMQGVVKVLETFSYVVEEEDDEAYEMSLTVDIVADYGKTWVKVATRNPFHLYQASVGHGKYGRKSIVEQVEDMVECASQNHHMFAAPKIVVRLAAGVTKELKELLDELGVEVIGEIVSPECEENFNIMCNRQSDFVDTLENQLTSLENIHLNIEEDSEPCSSDSVTVESSEENFFNLQSIPSNATLNLDVSTFLAYVSNMTNGHCHAKYKEKLLMDLAEMERSHPVKPVLDQLFQDRKLVCCETAHRDFLEILSTVGGDAEKQRASKMLHNVSIVPDNPSSKALALEKTSKIKERSKIVFGTGDSMKAVTVSANLGFLRAAQSQGIKFVAFVHESRALTECKELKTGDEE